jgi:hypothetical protein
MPRNTAIALFLPGAGRSRPPSTRALKGATTLAAPDGLVAGGGLAAAAVDGVDGADGRCGAEQASATSATSNDIGRACDMAQGLIRSPAEQAGRERASAPLASGPRASARCFSPVSIEPGFHGPRFLSPRRTGLLEHGAHDPRAFERL